MQLDDYITETICSVMTALRDTDQRLRTEDLGMIWGGDITTNAEHLVNVRMVKGHHPGYRNQSVNVILFDYDVHVEVRGGTSDEIGAGLGAKFLQVISAEAKGRITTSEQENQVQRLQFTIPVALPVDLDLVRPDPPTMKQRYDKTRGK